MPQLIGHRGAPRERPENTLAAFSRALELGAEGIELDVHATVDGVPVVHHDPGLEAGGPPIATLDHAALAQLAAASGKQVPTLAAVLALVGERADLYIELKGRHAERAVLDTIGSSGVGSRYAIHSFDHRATATVRSLDATIPGGILLVSYLVDTVAAMRAADARDVWMWWELIDDALIDAVHAAGGRVIAWTVNSASAAIRLASMGVDGLCTDDLPLLRSTLASRTRK